MKKTTSETRKYRSDMNEKILNSGFRDFNKFFALDNKAYVSGALPAKVKELMGLVGSMILRCNPPQADIFYHIDRSIVEGASREELMESFNPPSRSASADENVEYSSSCLWQNRVRSLPRGSCH